LVERVRHKACSRFEFRNLISFLSRRSHKYAGRGTSPRPIARNALLIAYFNDWREQTFYTQNHSVMSVIDAMLRQLRWSHGVSFRNSASLTQVTWT
jgi:hypothetical protein